MNINAVQAGLTTRIVTKMSLLQTRRSRCGFTRPIRYSPQLKKSGSHARMDRARIVAHDAPYDPLA